MVAAQEASDRAGQEERLEGLLGLLEGHHASILPLRLPGEQGHGSGAQTPDHRRRRDHAAHPWTSEERLHILPQHRVRGRLPVPGESIPTTFGDRNSLVQVYRGPPKSI